MRARDTIIRLRRDSIANRLLYVSAIPVIDVPNEARALEPSSRESPPRSRSSPNRRPRTTRACSGSWGATRRSSRRRRAPSPPRRLPATSSPRRRRRSTARCCRRRPPRGAPRPPRRAKAPGGRGRTRTWLSPRGPSRASRLFRRVCFFFRTREGARRRGEKKKVSRRREGKTNHLWRNETSGTRFERLRCRRRRSETSTSK